MMISDYNHVSEYAPFFEIDAHWDHDRHCLIESIQRNHDALHQRVFNTHLRWEMLPKQMSKEKDSNHSNLSGSSGSSASTLLPSCGKFIYITRNLPDVCASFYHHLSNQKEGTYQDNFSTFALDWMEGTLPFGSPLHHLLSYVEGFSHNSYADVEHESNDSVDKNPIKRQERPLLLLSYEKMKSNLRQEVLKIMDFLNITNIPMDVLDKDILPSFEFDSMKRNIDRFQPQSVTWLNGFQFLRRGESGDGRSMMMMNAIQRGEDGSETCVMEEYDRWVMNESYAECIDKLFNDSSKDGDDELTQLREVFLNVIKH